MKEILKAKSFERVLLGARLIKDRESIIELISIYNMPATRNNLMAYFEHTELEPNEDFTIGDMIRFNINSKPLYWKEEYTELNYFHNENMV